MRPNHRAGVLLAPFFVWGCTTDVIHHNLDLGPGGDAAIGSACSSDSDCDSGDKCMTATCNLTSKKCESAPKVCSGLDLCSTGSCDPATGCVLHPANEGSACSSGGGSGNCVMGVCAPPANCWCAPEQMMCAKAMTSFLSCGTPGTVGTFDDYSNALPPHLSGPGVMNAISTYACASGETASEVAYQLQMLAADANVTVTLSVTNPFPADMSPANTDLDLIVLDGDCTGLTACMNPPLGGGGYQGVTAGTGNETVTFHATAGHKYYLVVDGHNGGAADYHIGITCM